jgi:hypothetical protein
MQMFAGVYPSLQRQLRLLLQGIVSIGDIPMMMEMGRFMGLNVVALLLILGGAILSNRKCLQIT